MKNIARYIGKEWVIGDYDCWGFVRDYIRREVGVQLPHSGVNVDSYRAIIKAFKGSSIYGITTRLEKPEHNAVVVLGKTNAQDHCGIYLDESIPLLIHNVRNSGVVIDNFNSLNNAGYKIHGYYRVDG